MEWSNNNCQFRLQRDILLDDLGTYNKVYNETKKAEYEKILIVVRLLPTQGDFCRDFP